MEIHFNLTLLALIGILLIPFIQSSKPCVMRQYGRDSFVCVCNSTYCDSFDEYPKGKPGIVSMYYSDRSRFRFAYKTLVFTKSLSSKTVGVEVTIDRTKTFQTLLGFGGAFTDAASINILKLGSKLTTNIIEDYYGQNGLRYSMSRVPIGGSDFSTRPYSYDDNNKDDFDLKNFKLQPEDIHYKIPLIKQAIKVSRNKLKIFASPWSAPAWMKTNGKLNGKGSLKGEPNGKYYKTWAKYFIKFFDAYKNNGIDFWGLTIQNEPLDGIFSNFPFNCMAMSEKQQRIFIFDTLAPLLNVSGYGELKIMISDDQRPFSLNWANSIFSHPKASQYVAGLAFHWYLNSFTTPKILDDIHNKYPNFFLLSSEACEGSGPFEKEKVSLGNWQRAESYALDIIEDLQHYTAGWIDWNLALNLEGGPNWVKNFVDSPIIINHTSIEYYKQPMFYALSHFTRFLVPGSIRLNVKQNDQSLSTIVFATPDNQTIAVVLNRFQSSIPFQLNDPKLGSFQTIIMGHSIQTFVWST